MSERIQTIQNGNSSYSVGTGNPLFLFARAARLVLGGRVHLEKAPLDVVKMDQQECFRAFRKITVSRSKENTTGKPVMYQVRFTFKNLSPRANQRLSWMPVPFIVAQPGFISKTWLMGEQSGDFMGFYEFDSIESAQNYRHSFPLQLMRKRAATNSLTEKMGSESNGFCVLNPVDHICRV